MLNFDATWRRVVSFTFRPLYYCNSVCRRLSTLRLQVKLERAHRQKKKTNGLKNKRDQLVNRKKKSHLSIKNKLFVYQSGNQTDMELQNRTVWLHQKIQQHSHHAEIPIQNSQSHSKCTPVCNKSYSTYRLQRPLRK